MPKRCGTSTEFMKWDAYNLLENKPFYASLGLYEKMGEPHGYGVLNDIKMIEFGNIALARLVVTFADF